jgi:hypothetical protein
VGLVAVVVVLRGGRNSNTHTFQSLIARGPRSEFPPTSPPIDALARIKREHFTGKNEKRAFHSTH